jgi:ERCC4-type nuclease
MGDRFEWEIQNLPVGDAHIYTKIDKESEDSDESLTTPLPPTWQLRMIVERKQGQDVWQSIKDGRWKSQHERIESLSSPMYEGLDVLWVIENFKT